MNPCFCTGICKTTGHCPNDLSDEKETFCMTDVSKYIKSEVQKQETPEQKAARLRVPIIAPVKGGNVPCDNPVRAICGACGLELRRIMMYVCSRNDCPCGLGSAVSMQSK